MKVSLYKRGGVWWCRWRQDGVQRRLSFRTENRKVAEEMRVELEYKLLRGEHHPKERRKTPIQKLRDEYETWSKAHKRPRTVLNDTARIAAFVEFTGIQHVEDITTKAVMDFLANRALKHSSAPATLMRCREILHALMNYAMRVGYIDRNPVTAVPRPRIPQRDPRFLGLDQIRELLKAVGEDEIGPLVAVAVYCGLRREELCWLRCEDVEFGDPSVLRVRRKTVDGESWMPKTKRNRSIPVQPKLLRRLKHHLRGRKRVWLFPSPQGRRWDPDNLSRRFRSLMDQASLPWNLLDLRHTFGSQLARKGVSLLKISQLMGNSPEIARRHYIQLVPEEMAADVEF